MADSTQGCAITQHNPSLKVGLALAANTQTSSLSAIATTHLLSSPNLRWILELNSLRLSEAYRTVTSFFKWHSIQYVPANAGLFVFAKLAPGAKIWEDEAEVMEQCRQEGVLVSAGKNYHGIEDEKGWVRITFAVEKEVLKEGLERVAKALGLGSAAS